MRVASMARSAIFPARFAVATLALLSLAALVLIKSPVPPTELLGAKEGRGWAGQGGGRGAALTEKLENVFSAPLDAITGFFTKVHSLPSVQIRGRISLASRREAQPPGSHFPVLYARICARVRSSHVNLSSTGMWTHQPHTLL